jgi:hypothetical protein
LYRILGPAGDIFLIGCISKFVETTVFSSLGQSASCLFPE